MKSAQEAERERLTALGGLAALSLDALSSVAYGPEAILIVLVAAGTAGLRRAYVRIGAQLGIGQIPPSPVKRASLVVVPVMGLSRLTAEGISAALSLGDDVIAVTVMFTDADDEPPADVSFCEDWKTWRPEVPLITLRSGHRSIAKPIVSYLRSVEAEDKYHRLVVLIPEVQPAHWWQWLLHNQRGLILDRAIRRGTGKVVLCRLRYRLESLAAEAAASPTSTSLLPGAQDHKADQRRYREITEGPMAALGWQDVRHEFLHGT